jgi:hypothetical protein
LHINKINSRCRKRDNFKAERPLEFGSGSIYRCDLVVQQAGEEVGVVLAGDLEGEVPSGELVLVTGWCLLRQSVRDLLKDLKVVLLRDLLTLGGGRAMLGPLPELSTNQYSIAVRNLGVSNLRAGHLSGGSILHEEVDGNTADSTEPALHVSQTDDKIFADTFLSDGAGHVHVEKIHAANFDILTALEYLIRCGHVLVEHITGDLGQCGMRNPGTAVNIRQPETH